MELSDFISQDDFTLVRTGKNKLKKKKQSQVERTILTRKAAKNRAG